MGIKRTIKGEFEINYSGKRQMMNENLISRTVMQYISAKDKKPENT